MNLAVQWFGNGNAFAQIRSRLEKPDLAIGTDLEMWKQQGFSEGAIRNAIGLAAKTCDWFKIIERAEELARIVVEDWDNVTDKDLALKIGQLQQWIYE